MLHKYGLLIAKEEADKVDTLRYTLKKLLSRSTEVQNELVTLPPNFRGELIKNVEIFVEDCQHFYQDYDRVSPEGTSFTLRCSLRQLQLQAQTQLFSCIYIPVGALEHKMPEIKPHKNQSDSLKLHRTGKTKWLFIIN